MFVCVGLGEAGLELFAVLSAVWVQVRSLRRADEYNRIVGMEALAIGFATVMVLCFAANYVDALGVGDPRQSFHVTAAAGMLAWAIAHGLKTRHAR